MNRVDKFRKRREMRLERFDEWDESKHDRKSNGQFAPKNSGDAPSNDKEVKPKRNAESTVKPSSVKRKMQKLFSGVESDGEFERPYYGDVSEAFRDMKPGDIVVQTAYKDGKRTPKYDIIFAKTPAGTYRMLVPDSFANEDYDTGALGAWYIQDRGENELDDVSTDLCDFFDGAGENQYHFMTKGDRDYKRYEWAVHGVDNGQSYVDGKKKKPRGYSEEDYKKLWD